MFDIVIPVGPNDTEIISKQIVYTKKNIMGYRKIFLIYINESLQIDGCITVSEEIFPFNKKTVSDILGPTDRCGWYLQQLLKLYSSIVIPGILDKYLVIDADTFFLKPTAFLRGGRPLYNYSDEYHKPYFEHMNRLHDSLKRQVDSYSGICHHMFFETKYIKEIFSIVEENHGEFFYLAFLKCVADVSGSGASEYEIYFNYIMDEHRDMIKIRRLNWANTKSLDLNSDLDYISYHWYGR